MNLSVALRRAVAEQAKKYAHAESIPHCFSYGDPPAGSGPILIVSSEGLTLFVGCCINRLLCTKLSYTSYLSSERIQVRIEFADRQRERLRSQLSVGDKSPFHVRREKALVDCG